MNSATAEREEAKPVESVVLTCISCGKVEDIHVFRERKPPGKIFWECFDCQKREARN